MKTFYLLILLFVPIALDAQVVDDYLITQTSFGKIKRKTSYVDLKQLFGARNCRDAIEYGAEGMDSSTVTKLYAGTAKEIVIYWEEKHFHKQINTIEIFANGSPYHTKENLKIGTSLDQLLKVNGKRINFYGTSWDYGGTITSYNKGKLDKSQISFQLHGKSGLSNKLMGDIELHTDMPLVKKNITRLIISRISLSLGTN